MKLPALLLVPLYLAALAVALRDPAEHLLAGAVVLSAVLWRLRAPLAHVVSAVRPSRRVVEEVGVPATP